MKLTEQDKLILRNWGYPESDMKQLQRAASWCKYEGENDERLVAKEVISILGRETWLSGISRAAFHYSATRENNGQTVYFDCYAMHK